MIRAHPAFQVLLRIESDPEILLFPELEANGIIWGQDFRIKLHICLSMTSASQPMRSRVKGESKKSSGSQRDGGIHGEGVAGE